MAAALTRCGQQLAQLGDGGDSESTTGDAGGLLLLPSLSAGAQATAARSSASGSGTVVTASVEPRRAKSWSPTCAQLSAS